MSERARILSWVARRAPLLILCAMSACSLEAQQINTTVQVRNQAPATEVTLRWAWVDTAGGEPDYQIGIEPRLLETDATASFVLESMPGDRVQVQIEASTAGTRRTYTFDPIALTRQPHGELEFLYTHEASGDTFDCDFSYR